MWRNLLVCEVALAHIAPNLGLAMDFRATLCPCRPDLLACMRELQGEEKLGQLRDGGKSRRTFSWRLFADILTRVCVFRS